MQIPQNKSFNRLFFAHQRQIYGYILTLVPHRADADEVFQDTSVILWDKLAEYDEGREFLPWACGVAFNVVRNWRSKQRRDRHVFSDAFVEKLSDARIEAAGVLDARRAALAGCIDKLEERDRDLIDLCYTQQAGRQGVRAAAERFSITESAVYKSLNRVRRALFGCINRALGEEGAR
jgi:RNA polymerase sigma-70 factor (ECF subfamily)